MAWSRLVRFIPKSGAAPLLGEPLDASLDVGIAAFKGDEIKVSVYSGSSVLSPGEKTDRVELVGTLLSPLAQEEVGTIRCIGLNYLKHAQEAGMAIPKVPVLFLKPATALAGPYPEPTVIPKSFVQDNAADYEAELAVVIGKKAKNVSEAEALDHVLGYTSSNDVSSRVAQLAQSQWCYGKGQDGACPIGPALVSAGTVGDYTKLRMRGLKNGQVVQDTTLDDLIFSVPKIISFLSQGTTLLPGTLILTGTPSGIGWAMDPKGVLKDGDEFAVEVLPHIGTLINKVVFEK
ncbi:putative mitochondrion protein [Calocera viscosa TUFC12733]|uniref:Putative mitochondrion protein n=1 Tax=Calocera viscosa (strain TUFC12733) TaxID=1330018 RepID=A0A167JJP6_CALVF|nr:putative mitochondrion protein [Calocera viscosa TUFC12733]